MPQANCAPGGAQDSSRTNSAVHLAAIALRGAGQVCDMQLAASRVWWQTQARTAAAFGWPDLSDVFEQADGRARRAFESGAEQLLSTAQRAGEAAAELQRQVGRVVETQTQTAADNWQRGLEEIGSQVTSGLNQLCDTAREQAEESQRLTEALGDQARETLRRSAEPLQQGLQRGREIAGQAAEEARNSAEEAAGKQRGGNRAAA